MAFVEVKLRQNPLFNLSEVVTKSKQSKIIKTALKYVSENQIEDKAIRFDIALVEAGNEKNNIEYFPGAFTPSEYY